MEREEGESEGEEGLRGGRMEYIWRTTYLGRHVSCLEELK
jgi:hypothetical protein